MEVMEEDPAYAAILTRLPPVWSYLRTRRSLLRTLMMRYWEIGSMMSRTSLVTRARRSVAIASRRRRERYHRMLRRPHSRLMMPLLLVPVRTRVIIGIISVCRRRRRIETAMDIVMVGEGGGVAQRAAATAVAVGGNTAMIAAAQAVAAAISVAAVSVCADRLQAPHRSVELRCQLPSRAAGCAPETVGKGLEARRWFERR